MPQHSGSLVVTTVAADGRATRTFPLAPGDKVTFGRMDCNVILDSPTCSREHFEVANLNGECILRDLGSMNGCLVNGERVDTQALEAGDTIEAGVVAIHVRGSLSGPSLQVMMEVQGLTEAAPEIQPLEKTAKLRKSKSTVAGHAIADARKIARPAESTQAVAAVQDALPPLWQVCETLFDEPHGQLELARLADTLVASAGADRAAVMALPPAGDGEPQILADSSRPGTGPALPFLPEMVRGCVKLRGAISVPNVADDRRYQDAVRGDDLPGAAVTYAVVASLEKQYGILYAEWRAAEDPERTFAWTSSLARQVGLLAERNELAEELRLANKTLESAVEQRTRELTTANERLRQEIAERRDAEEALRRSEERFRALVESTSDWVWEVDADGVYTYASPKVKDLLGYEPEEVIGKRPFDLMPPAEAELVASQFAAMVESKKPFARLENVNRHKDGRSVVLETSGVPLLDANGQLRGFRGIDRDITDRRQAEGALAESEGKFRLLAEQALMGIMILQDDKVKYVNSAMAAIIGCSVEYLLRCGSADIFEYVHPDDRPFVMEQARKKQAGEADVVSHYTYHGIRHSGEDAWIELYSKTVVYEGQPADLVTIIDITERHRAEEEKARLEEQLRHSQKMEAIGTLAGGIAHDFNNLLTGILGSAQVLKLRGKPGDDVSVAAGVIERASIRAAELTMQLLGFARKGKLRDIPVDMHRVVGDVLAILSRTIDRQIDMTQRLRADPPLVTGDPGQLEQIVMNLAVNACDAMRGGGQLTFETDTVDLDEERCRSHEGISPGCYLVVSVADTGAGIPEDIRDRIFEPFFTTKELGRGIGMGLAMVYGIVKNHGGSIEIDSEPGSGATFNVYLPLAKDAARREIPEPAKPLVYGTGMILVVDDEESVRKSVESMLTFLGYEVVVARDGREAVEFCKSHVNQVDLVVLDMLMPIMDGRECFKRLKELDPGVKVLLATGHALDGDARELLDRGLLGFIKKPFTIAELSEAVARTLEAAPADEAKATKPAAVDEARRDGRPFRVLVVDDEDTVRETIVRFLESMGCEVTGASNAEEAVSTFLAARFDLVTLDFKMPGLDGMELHKVLSQEFGSGKRTDGPAAKTLPWIVVVTAYADAPEVVGRQFGESIVGIVRKPLIEEELGRIVRDLIARRPGRTELAG